MCWEVFFVFGWTDFQFNIHYTLQSSITNNISTVPATQEIKQQRQKKIKASKSE